MYHGYTKVIQYFGSFERSWSADTPFTYLFAFFTGLLPITQPLPTTHYPLLTTHYYSLPTTHYPLLATHYYPLPTTSYPLLATHY